MLYRVRDLSQEGKSCLHLRLESLERVVPVETVQSVLAEIGLRTPRERKLSFETMVWLAIAMNLYAHRSLGYVLLQMAQGLRVLGLDHSPQRTVAESAITYRRYQLGARPLVGLFRRICRPMACLQTPGAFLLGLRLMALDGHLVEVPDTPENAAYFGRFGRPRSDRGEAAYPKVQSVLLCELGTHAIVDAGFWPYGVSEQKGAFRLLRSLGPAMLVFGDRGLYSFDLVEAITKRGAQAVCRLS